MQLDQIADLFDKCFHDATVFERSTGGAVVETDVIRLEKKKWVVVAAGIEAEEAYRYFPDNSKRAERAVEPVEILPRGRLSLLIVVRSVRSSVENVAELDNVTAFALGYDIPLVQVRDGSFIRCWDIQDPDSRLHLLRWELDIQSARSDPHEEWLNNWKQHLNFNPAHSASHLHINAPAIVPNEPVAERIEHPPHELRLGVGVPNPLGLILSVATWLRSMPFVI
jgi:hypothetical protein